MKTIDMLRELVAFADATEEEYRDTPDELQWARAMRDILKKHEDPKFDGFTKRQREYVADVYERVSGTPTYVNAWSSGKVPRGEALATPVPEVLKRPLPLRPPGR